VQVDCSEFRRGDALFLSPTWKNDPMPTYDYECDACSHHWELFQKITDDPVKKCPKCGKKKAVRQFGTGAAIMFKGSGFYETDYRSESYKKSAEADKPKSSESTDSGGKSKSGASSESKSDSSATQSTKSDTPKKKKE
jgi:putative FmdB family regulatory protein